VFAFATLPDHSVGTTIFDCPHPHLGATSPKSSTGGNRTRHGIKPASVATLGSFSR
jgi:hypothetical protein